MSQRNVESLLGRLATNPDLRARFLRSPAEVLAELRAMGTELTAIEAAALQSLDGDALTVFAARIDRRIRRAASPEENAQDTP